MNKTKSEIKFSLPVIAQFAFFLLSVFYFYRFAGYIFYYQEKSKLFLLSFSYFTEFLKMPGGFLDWLSEFQTTFYFNPLIGAIIVSAEIFAIIYFIIKTGKEIAGLNFSFIPFLAGFLVFFLQINYQYLAINNLGILIQLAVFYLVIRFLKGKRIWFPILLFPLWHYLTGSFSLIFLAMFSLYIVIGIEKNKWLKLLILWIEFALYFYFSVNLIFYQTIERLVFYPFSKQNAGNQIPLFIAVVLLTMLSPLIFKYHFRWFVRWKIGKILVAETTPFLLIVIFGILAVSWTDKKNQQYFRAERLFYEQKFDELISFNEKNPSVNILTSFLNNVALAETGKLNELLFRFPQSADGSTLFLKWELATEVLNKGGYFYYAIGMINEAQRWAYEYMVMRGKTPEGIKMLIKTELINGNYKMASKYISILKQSVFYRKDAMRFEKMLNDKAVEQDAELGQKRKLRTKQDFFVRSEIPVANLEMVIAGDSANWVAVEYKFAWLLLQKDFESVTKNLPLLRNAGFEKIPKNIEEAVVAYSLLNLNKYPEFDGFVVNPQTVIRFNEYYGIFQQNSSNKLQAQAALRSFSDTYWYYVFFR